MFDHHYVFPRGRSGILEAELQAARELGLRFVASRGSMDLGASHGGLPPDSLVETLDEILADTERVAALADGDLLQIAVAPCSPFSVTRQLMVESAALARRLGLRLHTHLAETADEDEFCRERYGCTPVEYLDRRRLAGRRRLVRALRARARRRARALRAARRRRGALPRLEPAPRRRAWRPCARCSTPACTSASASTARPRTSAAT